MDIPGFYRLLTLFRPYIYALFNLDYYSIVDLQGRTGINGEKIYIDSYYANGLYPTSQKGGWRLVFKSTQAKSGHNGITIHSPTVPWTGTQATLSAYQAKTGETDPTGSGCWVLEYDKLIPEMAGAVGDKTTDDTGAFTNAITVLNAAGGGELKFSGAYLLDSDLSILEYVHVKGNFTITDAIRPALPGDYDGKASQLIVNSAKTITMQASASLGNCLIMRKGLDLPFADAAAATAGIAAFAGTAITLVNAGVAPYLHHMLIIGFDKAISGSCSAGRVRIEYVCGDCTNGIEIYGALDIFDLYGCHFWPFTTANKSWVTDALRTRTGTAYYFHDTADWCRATNCFSYGYAKGIDLYNVNSFTLTVEGSDWTTTNPASTTTGVHIRGTCVDAKIIGYQTGAQGTGIHVDCTTANRLSAMIIGATIWDADIYGIRVTNGRVLITTAAISGCPVGIEIDATCDDPVLIDYVDFNNCTTPINTSSTGLANTKIGDNITYTGCTPTISGNMPVTKTGDFTVAANEQNLINNKAGSTCVVTLPAATLGKKPIRILNYQAQLVNSASSNVIPISGGAAGTAILAATAGKYAVLVPNGTNWVIMEAN